MTRIKQNKKKNRETGRNKSNHVTKRWRGVIQNVWPQTQCTHLDIKRETIHHEGRWLILAVEIKAPFKASKQGQTFIHFGKELIVIYR